MGGNLAFALPPPLDDPGPVERVYIVSAMEWIENHSAFRFGAYGIDPQDPGAAANGSGVTYTGAQTEAGGLPAAVQLFILKYCEVMQSPAAAGVAGESLGGMSQSFSAASVEGLLHGLAGQLLGRWYNPCAFVASEGAWG